MNTKRLYQADGYAVREMLKATTLLYDALLDNTSHRKDEHSSIFSAINTANEISSKVSSRQKNERNHLKKYHIGITVPVFLHFSRTS